MKYRTIVADPPWDHSDGTGLSLAGGGGLVMGDPWAGQTRTTKVPYSCMSVDEIAAIPVDRMADSEAHLYLWTTNRFLRQSYEVAETWGFLPVKPLVWCKSPKGFMGGSFTSSVEYILFARRGSLAHLSRAGTQWWTWKRGKHSAKPEAFLDMVEAVSPGPYLELFARRQRLGWHTWGNEALQHVELEGTA